MKTMNFNPNENFSNSRTNGSFLNSVKLTIALFVMIVTTNLSFGQFCGTPTSTIAISPSTTSQNTPSYSNGFRVFTFNAQAGCTYVWTTCGQSSIDTYFRIHNTATGVMVAANDDWCGLQSYLSWTCTSTGNYSMHLSRYVCNELSSATVMSYYISGCATAPANDNCSNAAVISSLPYTSAIVNTLAAVTDEPSVSTSCGTIGSNVWYKVTGTGGNMTASTVNGTTNFDNEVRVYSGSCGSFTSVVCNDNFSGTQAQASWCSTPGVEYYITVGSSSNGTATGDFQLTVTSAALTSATTPVNSDYVWQGRTSSDWFTNSNWYVYNGSTYNVATSQPQSSNNVIIPSSGTCVSNMPTIGSGAGNSKNISIESSGALTIGSGSLTTTGNWTNNGTFNQGTSTIVLSSNSAQTVNGSGTTNFYNLTSLNNGTGITLNTPVTVSNAFNMQAGNIYTTNTNLLTVGVNAVASLNWSNGTIVGPLKRWFAASSNSGNISGVFPVGNSVLGTIVNRWALLEYTAAPTTAGYLKVEFKGVNPTTTSAGTNGLTLVDEWNWQIDHIGSEGYWEIVPTTIAGGTYNLKLRGNQFNSVFDYSATRLIKSPNTHTTWTLNGTHGTITGNQSDFTVSRTGMTGFSYFAIGFPTAAPLPIELTSFQANCKGDNTAEISWTTASEHNTDNFIVEKSRDGVNWESIHSVQAAGNSTSTINYAVLDENVFNSTNYYRLTQFDMDGKFEVFDIVSLNCNNNEVEKLQSVPNPSQGDFIVQLKNSLISGLAQIELRNMDGTIVYSEQITIENENANFHLNNLNLAKGVYIVTLVQNNEVKALSRHCIQ